MQIGSGNNSLPGCPSPTGAAPAPSAPVAAPPVAPAMSAGSGRGGGEQTVDKKATCLVVGVLLLVAAAAAAYMMIGRDLQSVGGSGNPAAGKMLLAKLMGSMPAAAAGTRGTNIFVNGVTLTPAQQQLVTEYSPANQIREARRVKQVERTRAADQEGDASSNTAPAAVIAPVPVALEPAPVAVGRTHPLPLPRVGAGAVGSPGAVGKAVPWPEIKITAVIGGQQGRWFARINNRLVSVGDSVEGASVVSISAQSVTLSCNGQQRDFPVGSGR